jgi:peptide deformylase
MAIRPIIEIPDPRLRQISAPVETFDAALQTLIDDMFETMYAAPGIGLAAIQVDVPLRLLVIDLQDRDDEGAEEGSEASRNPLVFINPEFSDPSEDETVYNEGCLSIPDQFAEVVRPSTIRAKWLDREGKAHDERIDGLLATCLQHEVDHLNGIVFTDHLSRMKRDMLLKKLEKQRKQNRAA